MDSSELFLPYMLSFDQLETVSFSEKRNKNLGQHLIPD